MVKPDSQTIRAINSLSNNEAFRIFLQWIKDSMVEQSIKNNHSEDDSQTKRNQGANLELESLLKEIERAKTPIIKSPGVNVYS